jgi:hypothetical protein
MRQLVQTVTNIGGRVDVVSYPCPDNRNHQVKTNCKLLMHLQIVVAAAGAAAELQGNFYTLVVSYYCWDFSFQRGYSRVTRIAMMIFVAWKQRDA